MTLISDRSKIECWVSSHYKYHLPWKILCHFLIDINLISYYCSSFTCICCHSNASKITRVQWSFCSSFKSISSTSRVHMKDKMINVSWNQLFVKTHFILLYNWHMLRDNKHLNIVLIKIRGGLELWCDRF